MQGSKYKVEVTEKEKKELEKIVRRHNASQKLVRRARIILEANKGMKYKEIAEELKIGRNVITTWVKRWIETSQELSVAERLDDLARPGAPDTFSAAEICQMTAIACEKPEEYGRPITHWTRRELADEIIKQGIVESISERHLGRILGQFDLRPHKSQYWLNGKPDEKKKKR